MILIIDNFDSFTYNLVQYVGAINQNVKVIKNDEMSLENIRELNVSHIIISPGPGGPKETGICIDVINNISRIIPTLGICLGHQTIAYTYNSKIVQSKNIMHGKTSSIYHTGTDVFKGFENPFTATRYHSLVIEKNTLPKELKIVAETADGSIMGITHESMQTYGVQFHPESIASEHGYDLLKNFLNLISEGASLP